MAIIKEVNGKVPKIDETVYLADNAVIIGDVEIQEYSSIWFNVVIRGDVNYIRIGKYTNIQDGTVIHATYQKYPTVIGDYVTVGHNAVIHACTLEDKVLVGMGAVVMDNAVVHTGAIIAAGAVVLPGTEVESYCIYAGVPAKKVKCLPPEQALKETVRYAENYLKYAEWYKGEKF